MKMNKFVKYRREFHQYPELGWREIRTSARIAEILEEMGYKCLMGTDVINESSITFEMLSDEEKETEKKRAVAQGATLEYVNRTEGYPGVIAELNTGKEGPVTVFRFDIDCLPYQEPQKAGFRPFDEGFISCNSGSVHACGHDAHTAIGLGMAEKLLEKKDRLKGKLNIILHLLSFISRIEHLIGFGPAFNKGGSAFSQFICKMRAIFAIRIFEFLDGAIERMSEFMHES